MQFDYTAEYKHVRIRPLAEKDIEFLRAWRNNPELTFFLKDIGYITPEMQKRWYENEVKNTTCYTFAIDEISDLNRVVGSVSIYDIKDNHAEIGKILVGDPKARGEKTGYYALILAMHIGFQKMGIKEFSLDVHEDNAPAKAIYSKAGFTATGKHEYEKGGMELEMSLSKERFYEVNTFSGDFSF